MAQALGTSLQARLYELPVDKARANHVLSRDGRVRDIRVFSAHLGRLKIGTPLTEELFRAIGCSRERDVPFVSPTATYPVEAEAVSILDSAEVDYTAARNRDAPPYIGPENPPFGSMHWLDALNIIRSGQNLKCHAVVGQIKKSIIEDAIILLDILNASGQLLATYNCRVVDPEASLAPGEGFYSYRTFDVEVGAFELLRLKLRVSLATRLPEQ